MLRSFLLGLLGTAAFAAVYVALAPRPTQPVESAEETTVAEAPPADPPEPIHFELRPASEPSDESLADAIRDVTPVDLTTAPLTTGTLSRAEPRREAAPSEASREAHSKRLFSPVIVWAGAIEAEGETVRLGGIAAPDFGQRCGAGQDAWPCGRMARAALRRFVRGRAIECEVPAGEDAVPDPARCQVGGEDIAQWLVARGWAKTTGNAYRAEEEEARDAKRGLWGEGRPGARTVAASD